MNDERFNLCLLDVAEIVEKWMKWVKPEQRIRSTNIILQEFGLLSKGTSAEEVTPITKSAIELGTVLNVSFTPENFGKLKWLQHEAWEWYKQNVCPEAKEADTRVAIFGE